MCLYKPAELLVIVSKTQCLGRLFQMVGPQTEKAPWPNCVHVMVLHYSRSVD